MEGVVPHATSDEFTIIVNNYMARLLATPAEATEFINGVHLGTVVRDGIAFMIDETDDDDVPGVRRVIVANDGIHRRRFTLRLPRVSNSSAAPAISIAVSALTYTRSNWKFEKVRNKMRRITSAIERGVIRNTSGRKGGPHPRTRKTRNFLMVAPGHQPRPGNWMAAAERRREWYLGERHRLRTGGMDENAVYLDEENDSNEHEVVGVGVAQQAPAGGGGALAPMAAQAQAGMGGAVSGSKRRTPMPKSESENENSNEEPLQIAKRHRPAAGGGGGLRRNTRRRKNTRRRI